MQQPVFYSCTVSIYKIMVTKMTAPASYMKWEYMYEILRQLVLVLTAGIYKNASSPIAAMRSRAA